MKQFFHLEDTRYTGVIQAVQYHNFSQLRTNLSFLLICFKEIVMLIVHHDQIIMQIFTKRSSWWRGPWMVKYSWWPSVPGISTLVTLISSLRCYCSVLHSDTIEETPFQKKKNIKPDIWKIFCQKKGGRELKAVWNFTENSSIWVVECFPKLLPVTLA